MSSPSISVMKFGRALIFASHLRQSCAVHPILRELLHRRELDALRCVRDLFALGPLGCFNAIAQVDEVGLRSLEMKRTNSGVVSHGLLPLRR